MFNTTVHKTENHNLKIAAKQRYEAEIGRLRSQVSNSCTPDQLQQADRIANEFREKLVFQHCSAENSVFNLVTWVQGDYCHELHISFELNGKQITTRIPNYKKFLATGKPNQSMVDEIREAVVEAITDVLFKDIVIKLLEKK